MTTRKPLPTGLSTPAFRIADALAAGASRGRLDRRDLAAPFHGVRLRGEPDFLGRCHALAAVMRPGNAFSGVTAARIWDLPLPASHHDELAVSSLHPRRALRRPGVRGSQRGHGMPTSHRSLPVLSPEQTFVSLGSELDIYDLTAVADRLISGTLKTQAVSSRGALERELELKRAPHVRTLRRALADARSPVWSRPESLLRILIVAAGLPNPVVSAGGERVDLAWPAYRVAAEYDGTWHDSTPGQAARDARRHEAPVDDGWLLVRVRSADLFRSPHVLVARLVHRLSSRGWTLARAIDVAHLPRLRP